MPPQSNMPERLSDLYLAAMLSLFLLFPGFEGYSSITAHKTALFALLTISYFLGLLLCPGRKKFFVLFRKQGPVSWLIWGYWGFTALSTLWSVDRSIALWGGTRQEGLLMISLYCLSFFLLSFFARPKPWLLGVFGVSVSLNCLVALAQLAGLDPLNLYPDGLTYYDAYVHYPGEYLGTIGNADLLSALLCLAIPVFWIALLRLPGDRKYLLALPLTLSLLVLGLSGVAGGVVGVLGSLLLGLPVILPGKKQQKIALRSSICVMLYAFAAVYCFGGATEGFLFESHELLHGRVSEDFGSGRVYIWQEVLSLVPERLLLGGGPDTLGLRTDAAFERFDSVRGVLLRTTVDAAHSEYLHILVNQGLLSLLCWLGALLLSARRWIKTAPRSPLAAMLGGGVLGYCIQAFFGLSSPITTPFLWISLALLTGTGVTRFR